MSRETQKFYGAANGKVIVVTSTGDDDWAKKVLKNMSDEYLIRVAKSLGCDAAEDDEDVWENLRQAADDLRDRTGYIFWIVSVKDLDESEQDDVFVTDDGVQADAVMKELLAENGGPATKGSGKTPHPKKKLCSSCGATLIGSEERGDRCNECLGCWQMQATMMLSEPEARMIYDMAAAVSASARDFGFSIEGKKLDLVRVGLVKTMRKIGVIK